MCVCERERHTQRHTERHTETHTETKQETETEAEIEREREKERESMCVREAYITWASCNIGPCDIGPIPHLCAYGPTSHGPISHLPCVIGSPRPILQGDMGLCLWPYITWAYIGI